MWCVWRTRPKALSASASWQRLASQSRQQPCGLARTGSTGFELSDSPSTGLEEVGEWERHPILSAEADRARRNSRRPAIRGCFVRSLAIRLRLGFLIVRDRWSCSTCDLGVRLPPTTSLNAAVSREARRTYSREDRLRQSTQQHGKHRTSQPVRPSFRLLAPTEVSLRLVSSQASCSSTRSWGHGSEHRVLPYHRQHGESANRPRSRLLCCSWHRGNTSCRPGSLSAAAAAASPWFRVVRLRGVHVRAIRPEAGIHSLFDHRARSARDLRPGHRAILASWLLSRQATFSPCGAGDPDGLLLFAFAAFVSAPLFGAAVGAFIRSIIILLLLRRRAVRPGWANVAKPFARAGESALTRMCCTCASIVRVELTDDRTFSVGFALGAQAARSRARAGKRAPIGVVAAALVGSVPRERRRPLR